VAGTDYLIRDAVMFILQDVVSRDSWAYSR